MRARTGVRWRNPQNKEIDAKITQHIWHTLSAVKPCSQNTADEEGHHIKALVLLPSKHPHRHHHQNTCTAPPSKQLLRPHHQSTCTALPSKQLLCPHHQSNFSVPTIKATAPPPPSTHLHPHCLRKEKLSIWGTIKKNKITLKCPDFKS